MSSAPGEPISLALAKRQANIDHGDDDELISDVIIPAVRDRAERYLNRILVQRQVRVVFDDFQRWTADSALVLPIAPVQSIVSVHYRDANDDTQELDASYFRLDRYNEPCRLFPSRNYTWPAITLGPAAVEVVLLAGYPPADDPDGGSPTQFLWGANIPASIRHAMLMDVAHLYDHRASVADFSQLASVPLGYEHALHSYRLMGVPT